MKDFKQYASRIVEQIFEADNAFFLEVGLDPEKAMPLEIYGAYGGVLLKPAVVVEEIRIVLEASDLYTVTAIYQKEVDTIQHVVDLKTKKPVEFSKNQRMVKFERVFAFDLIDVLWAICYRHGTL